MLNCRIYLQPKSNTSEIAKLGAQDYFKGVLEQGWKQSLHEGSLPGLSS